MGIHYNTKRLPATKDLLSLVDAANPRCTTGSGNIIDLVNTSIAWTRQGTVTDTTSSGTSCWNMDSGYLETSSTGVFSRGYTVFYLWLPRTSDSGWRTLHRNSDDHVVIVQDGGKSLGMYSNRNGSFRDTGYDISVNWQTLIVTAYGNSISDAVGTGTFYVNGSSVGTTDRVSCGTDLYGIGWSGQGPGKLAVAGVYNKQLSSDEIKQLHDSLKARII